MLPLYIDISYLFLKLINECLFHTYKQTTNKCLCLFLTQTPPALSSLTASAAAKWANWTNSKFARNAKRPTIAMRNASESMRRRTVQSALRRWRPRQSMRTGCGLPRKFDRGAKTTWQISMQDVFNAFGEIMTTASLVHREAFKTNVLQINKEWAQSDIVNGEPEQMSQRVFIERMNRFAVMVQQVFELPPMEQAATQQSTISNVMHEVVQPVQVDESEHPIFNMVAENGAGNVFNVQADFAEWPSDFDYEEAAENFSSINAVTFERAAKFNKNIKCYKCGKNGHYRSECRTGTAQSAAIKCFRCGKTGHYANKCSEGRKGENPHTGRNVKSAYGKSLFVKKKGSDYPQVATVEALEDPTCEAVFEIWKNSDGDFDVNTASVLHGPNFGGA